MTQIYWMPRLSSLWIGGLKDKEWLSDAGLVDTICNVVAAVEMPAAVVFCFTTSSSSLGEYAGLPQEHSPGDSGELGKQDTRLVLLIKEPFCQKDSLVACFEIFWKHKISPE